MESLGSLSLFWCYHCNHIVRVPQNHVVILYPGYNSGFLEDLQTPPHTRRSMSDGDGGGSLFYPIIVLLNANDVVSSKIRNFKLYYNDSLSNSSGPISLHPLPQGVYKFLIGSDFENLLEQLDLVVGGAGAPPPTVASKVAIESKPVIKILASHTYAKIPL